MSAYLAVPYEFHLGRNSASLIKNIIIECSNFYHFCILPFLNLIANFVIICFLLLLLAQTDLILLAMILGIILPAFILFNLLGKKFQKWGQIASQSREEMIRTINHGLGGLKETRVIGCEAYFQKQMEQQARKNTRVTTLFQSSQILPRILIETTLILFSILFISLSHILFKQNIQDLTGVLGVFAVASMRLISASSQCIQSINQMRKGSYTLDMLYLDLREIEKEKINKHLHSLPNLKVNGRINSKNIESQLITFKNQVELKNVTYHYPGVSENAIDNISLSIKKGQSIALIGKSGAGKTTLVDIILGLLKPGNGDILVDNVSIYDNLRSWQNLVGYIPQSIFLTDDTIERNIAFGVRDHLINSEKLNEAIKAAQLSQLVEQLSNGIKTQVGERGVRLSGGQRQRVGIARALYHEREILVLDEATAALDNETEKLVSEAIKSLAGEKTLIIIAHRLSTVEHCDKVYLLEKGRVTKSGSYQEVVLETC